MTTAAGDSDLLRLLRKLAPAGSNLRRAAPGGWTLERVRGTRIAVAAKDAESLVRRGLVATRDDGSFALADTGAAWLRRALAGADVAFASQHQERGPAVLADNEPTPHGVTINHDESPLAWLRRRRDRDGRPMVDAPSFAAGERLRSDFTRGQMMPRVTANWTAAVATGGRSGSGAAADLTEVAIAARLRVERAVHAVGPELAGVLLDFCCFLKGLESIEAERRWPPRSAKVALKIALAVLARHYGLSRVARGRTDGAILHWGAEDYRPAID